MSLCGTGLFTSRNLFIYRLIIRIDTRVGLPIVCVLHSKSFNDGSHDDWKLTTRKFSCSPLDSSGVRTLLSSPKPSRGDSRLREMLSGGKSP